MQLRSICLKYLFPFFLFVVLFILDASMDFLDASESWFLFFFFNLMCITKWLWLTSKVLVSLSLVGATWLLIDSTYFFPAFSLVFLPSSILQYHRPNQFLYSLNNNINTYTEGLPTSHIAMNVSRKILNITFIHGV